jgi:hypothetical protein
MASGRPFKPSQQQMSTSLSPRLRGSVSTVIQCLDHVSCGEILFGMIMLDG